jgi:methyltransferase-like protein
MDALHTDYDRLPYESYSFWQTHISHLHLIGRVFGMAPADVRKSRVLELGGASGGNLIPMALQYPQSHFICVDLSAVQTAEGASHARALGLSNIEFRNQSILDFTDAGGKFDYVICHGVYSWVPAEVQEAILRIARDHLAPQGISYVSYNTLPGWNMVRSVREMMLYHCANLPDPEAKARQARTLLKFVLDSQGAGQSPWADSIRAEYNLLATQPNWYLAHDHLEENNHPCYFYQFMERAGRHALQYLGDASIDTMYLGNMPELVSETLAPLNDIVRMEQYMDFVRNRRFRSTLLCRAECALTRNVDSALVDGLHILSRLEPETPDEPTQDAPGRKFSGPGGLQFTSSNAVTTAVFLALARLRTRPASSDAIVADTLSRHKEMNAESVRTILRANILRLFFSGGMELHAYPPAYTDTVSAKPVALAAARYQASLRTQVTNGKHLTLGLTPLERIIIQQLDGTRSLADLPAIVAAEITRHGLSVQRDGQALQQREEIERELATVCETALRGFANHALLIA